MYDSMSSDMILTIPLGNNSRVVFSFFVTRIVNLSL
jgi:hypothetical protein